MFRTRSQSIQPSRLTLNHEPPYRRRSPLALEYPGSSQRATLLRLEPGVPPRSAQSGAAAALQYFAAPWMAPVRPRCRTANRPLIFLLDWLTARIWPLAVLDDIAAWLQEGSAAGRMLLGSVAAALLFALSSLQWAPLDRLQSLTLLPPIFAAHSLIVLLAASFLIGAVILPALVGHLLPVLLRLYILANLCAFAALLGYGIWLLYSSFKF